MGERLTAELIDFSGGLNTATAAHLLQPNEVRIARWVDVNADGAADKAKGLELYAELGDGSGVQGLYVYNKPDGTEILLAAWDQRLYKIVAGVQTQIPIRLYAPVLVGEGLGVTDTGTGTAGANLAGSTSYYFLIVAKKGAGAVASAVASITTGATPHPLKIVARGSYGAETYEVYRKTGAGGAWGRLASGLTHADTVVGGGRLETCITWTDDGSVAPDTDQQPPTDNTTELILPAEGRPDWQTFLGRVYFVAGDGLLWTDGTDAGVVAPAAYDATLTHDSQLALFSAPHHTCTVLCIHQNYLFLAGGPEPTKLYYSLVGKPAHFLGLDLIDAPDAGGGRINGAEALYDALAVSLTTGRYTLHGTVFRADSDLFNAKWSKVSSVGVTSGRAIVRMPMGGRDVLCAPTADRNISILTTDATVETYLSTRSVADHIRRATEPDVYSLADVSDWTNAVAAYHKGRYVLSFPGDSQVWTGYPDRRQDGRLAWYGPRDGISLSCFTTLADGSLLAGDAQTGKVYTFAMGYALPDGSAYTSHLRTRTISTDLRKLSLKKLKVRGKQHESPSRAAVTAVADYDISTGALPINFQASFVIGTAVIGGSHVGYVEAPFEDSGVRVKGNTLYLEVTAEHADEPLTVYGFYLIYSLKKPR